MLDANSPAPQFDLIRVVTLHAAIVASGSLTYLVGCGVASYDSNQVSYL